MAENPGLLNLPGKPLTDDDFTIYLTKEEFSKCWPWWEKALTEERNRHYDLKIPVKMGGKTYYPRVHAVKCFSGRYYSVTLRSMGVSGGEPRTRFDTIDEVKKKFPGIEIFGAVKNDWRPEKNFEPVPVLVDVLYDTIIGEESPAGLILLTGETGSGKTTYLNGLLKKYLEILWRPYSPRRPHIVAVGDPVETFLYEKKKSTDVLRDIAIEQNNSEGLKNRPFDFTARTIGEDVESIRQATTDALRETPKVFIIGELREPDDFRAALELGGTGHLVLATSHSTTLIDAMDKLLRYTDARTAAGRATVASQLCAIIHHRLVYAEGECPVFDDKAGEWKVESGRWPLNVPSVWVGHTEGRYSLVGEGLSSLVSRAPTQQPQEFGALGRYWMAMKLRNARGKSRKAAPFLPLGTGQIGSEVEKCYAEVADKLYPTFRKEALKLDLSNR